MSIVIISLVCNIMLSKYGAIVINIVVGIIIGAQPILGYNYGARNYDRVRKTFKTVLLLTILVGIISTLIFELCPQIVIKMFGTESDLYMEFAIMTFRIFLMLVTFTCTIKMISIFFQAVGEPIKAAIVSLLRDIVCFVPLVIILPKFLGVTGTLWAAPIADLIGIIFSSILVVVFFRGIRKAKIENNIPNAVLKKSAPGVIITIARQHGSQGKYIGKLVAEKLNIPYYYKEMTALAAQDRVIKEIAENGSCVIVGIAADYVLRDNKDLVKIFIYAPKDYRISNVMKMYNDSRIEATKNVEKSDKTRANYYKTISDLEWGKLENYDLCINSSIGKEETANIICEFVKAKRS